MSTTRNEGPGLPAARRPSNRRELDGSLAGDHDPGGSGNRGLPQAEATLLHSILQSLAEGVVVADRSGRFLLFNRAAERILGVGYRDVPWESWPDVYGFFRSDMVTRFPASELPLSRAIRGETVIEEEVFVRNPSAPEGAWIAVNASPLADGDGRPAGGVAVFRVVTEYKRHEQVVRLLSSAVEQTADSVVITDRNGIIQYVNPGFEKSSGYSRDEILGRTPQVLKSGAHDRSFYARLWGTLLSGEVFRDTIVNRKKNGDPFFAEQTITPLKDESGAVTHFVSVGKDVTELRKAEEEKAKMRVARAVQQKLYPAAPPPLPGFDIAGAASLADATGGDYFDFIPMPGGCLGIAIGDVSGHGVGAALLMAETRAYLRSFAQTYSDVGEILDHVNRALAGDITEDSFVTLLLARLDPARLTLTYANAGHPPAFVIGGSRRVKNVLRSTGVPLGPFPERHIEEGPAVRLRPGDTVVFVTDGITETGAADNREFGSKRVLECIRASAGGASQDIVTFLFEAVDRHAAGLAERDDMTALVCKVLGRMPRRADAKRGGVRAR